jgi:predicted permease
MAIAFTLVIGLGLASAASLVRHLLLALIFQHHRHWKPATVVAAAAFAGSIALALLLLPAATGVYVAGALIALPLLAILAVIGLAAFLLATHRGGHH